MSPTSYNLSTPDTSSTPEKLSRPITPMTLESLSRSSTPLSRPALLRKATRVAFHAVTSIYRLKKFKDGEKVGLQPLYLGLAVDEKPAEVEIGYSFHDGCYCTDYAITTIQTGSRTTGKSASAHVTSEAIADDLIQKLHQYEQNHAIKFIGAGLTAKIAELSPELPSRLWKELDCVPLILKEPALHSESRRAQLHPLTVDEKADSMARKCLFQFGPSDQPRLCVGFDNEVQVDSKGRAKISSKEDFQSTVGEATWEATMKYAQSLKDNNIRIAFFNSTPQGGGVALMRHALIRFLRTIGVTVEWYVPKPKPGVFRITKNNHNILQGIAEPHLRLNSIDASTLDAWCKANADRHWILDNGALAPVSEGGAHVIIVDDPQMPSLVKIAKEQDPDRPVIFRSHIQVRADLADQAGTPTSEVWNWVQRNIEKADVFISHPVRDFVPKNIDINKVGYMPATTDWLDGLNKDMNDLIKEHYLHEFNNECFRVKMNGLNFRHRKYIVQIARFDPAKGIPDVIASYAKLRREYMKDWPVLKTPQLVIAGHGAVDDPDWSLIHQETMELLDGVYKDIAEDITVMRLGPTDQVLNALMSCAHVALQLSTREGFEVKVSEALHKGVPIIATRAGGIPLQVEDGKSGFLVEPRDSSAVAKHLYDLFTDEVLYDEMAFYAKHHVSDEVSTVGNALCWLYLADMLSQKKEVKPDCGWINDMAREEAGLPYVEGEPRLPRDKKLNLHHAAVENEVVLEKLGQELKIPVEKEKVEQKEVAAVEKHAVEVAEEMAKEKEAIELKVVVTEE